MRAATVSLGGLIIDLFGLEVDGVFWIVVDGGGVSAGVESDTAIQGETRGEDP